MKKSYPPREDEIPVYWFDHCECGHGWEDHPYGWTFVVGRGKCERCMCPKYVLDRDNLSEHRKKWEALKK